MRVTLRNRKWNFIFAAELLINWFFEKMFLFIGQIKVNWFRNQIQQDTENPVIAMIEMKTIPVIILYYISTNNKKGRFQQQWNKIVVDWPIPYLKKPKNYLPKILMGYEPFSPEVPSCSWPERLLPRRWVLATKSSPASIVALFRLGLVGRVQWVVGLDVVRTKDQETYSMTCKSYLTFQTLVVWRQIVPKIYSILSNFQRLPGDESAQCEGNSPRN